MMLIMVFELFLKVFGEFIVFYEYIIFVQGVVWGIDFFDQWGVELGKKFVLQIVLVVFGDDDVLKVQDLLMVLLVMWYCEYCW